MNNYNLSLLGYKDFYILTKSGEVFNRKTNSFLNKHKHCYSIQLENGKFKTVSIKTLYRKAFNKEFCIDKIQLLIGEEFKPIENTNGKLFVSNYGRIKSYKGYNARLLKTFINNKGYLRVDINGKKILVHRLVASAFIPKEENRIIVHHKDGDKTNNMLLNLQWATHKENAQFYYISKKEKQKYNE